MYNVTFTCRLTGRAYYSIRIVKARSRGHAVDKAMAAATAQGIHCCGQDVSHKVTAL